MIEFEHVYKTYETHNDENVALEDINIHIEEGEFVFILGHSGAGKSTFLKLIQMEEKPTKGKVFINGQDLTRIRRRKVPYLRRQMGDPSKTGQAPALHQVHKIRAASEIRRLLADGQGLFLALPGLHPHPGRSRRQ